MGLRLDRLSGADGGQGEHTTAAHVGASLLSTPLREIMAAC